MSDVVFVSTLDDPIPTPDTNKFAAIVEILVSSNSLPIAFRGIFSSWQLKKLTMILMITNYVLILKIN